jgi:biopolymer transport protein ExbD
MRFFIRKRRSPPAIIVVALIDVLIVLLIFLMVTTTFKQQSAMQLALPESTQSEKTGSAETTPLIVSIDPQGNLRLGGGPDALPVTSDNLKRELVARATGNPEVQLAINGDKGAPWGQVVKVMDLAKEAKIKFVSAYTKDVSE